jgi:hypothetical protein
VRRTLLLENYQEKKKINLIIKKNLYEAPSFKTFWFWLNRAEDKDQGYG